MFFLPHAWHSADRDSNLISTSLGKPIDCTAKLGVLVWRCWTFDESKKNTHSLMQIDMLTVIRFFFAIGKFTFYLYLNCQRQVRGRWANVRPASTELNSDLWHVPHSERRVSVDLTEAHLVLFRGFDDRPYRVMWGYRVPLRFVQVNRVLRAVTSL